MGFSRQPASQNIEPSWVENDPNLVESIEKNDNRGDFIMTLGRNILDETLLAKTFAKHLNGQDVHHMKVSERQLLISQLFHSRFDLQLEKLFYEMPTKDQLAGELLSLTGDHVRFWYYQELLAEPQGVRKIRYCLLRLDLSSLIFMSIN